MDWFLYDNGLCHKKVKYFWEHRGKGTIQNHPNYVLLHFLLSFQNVNFQKVLCAGLISVHIFSLMEQVRKETFLFNFKIKMG